MGRTTLAVSMTPASILSEQPAQLKLRPWWQELLVVGGFYFLYEWVASVTSGSRTQAMRDAGLEVKVERGMHIFNERAFQQGFLPQTWLIKTSDVFYTTVHFVLPVVVLVWLYTKAPNRYARWRNTFAWMTLISLGIFVLFPVAPPRLLPASFGFVDTLAKVGGGGPFESYLMKSAGDAYAAMPSLHFAWAAWCALALAPIVRNRLVKTLLWADPAITAFVVIVTANHYYLDLVAGGAVLAAGIALAGRDRVTTKPQEAIAA